MHPSNLNHARPEAGVSNPVREDQATKDETSASAENLETKLAATEGDHDERAKLHMRWAICPFIEHLSGKTREIGRDIGFVYDYDSDASQATCQRQCRALDRGSFSEI